MILQALASAVDLLGTVAFAITGALVASRKQMDITGFALLAIVTGIGGGTLRDLLLGAAPIGWVRDPTPLVLCAVVAVATFFTAESLRSRYRAILWCDALGLALFSVTGTEVALAAGAHPVAACTMGVITACFGGIIRDVLSGEVPLILSREIYVTAALAGAALYVASKLAGLPREIAFAAGFAVSLTLRVVAMIRGWSLPRHRPGRPFGGEDR